MKNCECSRRTDPDDSKVWEVTWSADCPEHGQRADAKANGQWWEPKR